MIVATPGIPSAFNWATVEAPDYGLTSKKELSSSEKEEVKQLKALDKQVRAHEQEHLRVGGALVRSGGASFEYTMGPDGKLYAARGGVDVDSDPIKGDPKGSIDKAAKLHKTALAAGLDASLQDRRVAAVAEHMANNAYAEQDAIQTTEAKLVQAKMAYTLAATSRQSTINTST
jgi:hypothetical protein